MCDDQLSPAQLFRELARAFHQQEAGLATADFSERISSPCGNLERSVDLNCR